MTASLYDMDGAYIGPVPEWLTIPEPVEGYLYSEMISRGHIPLSASMNAIPTETLYVRKLVFLIGHHRNGALKYRIADKDTQDWLAELQKEADRW